MAYTKITVTNDDINNVKNESESFIKDHTNEEFVNQVPVTYINSLGTYVFRVFPDSYKGHVRTFRPMFMHNFTLKGLGKGGSDYKFKCINNEKVSKLLSKFSDEELGGSREAWKYKAKEQGLMLARIYSAPTSDAYTKKLISDSGRGFVDAIIVLTSSVMKEVQSRISELDPRNMIEFLDIDSPSSAISLSITEESNADSSRKWRSGMATFTKEQYAMSEPIFPEGVQYDGLDKAYVASDRFITDTEFDILSRYLNGLKSNSARYVKSASKDGFSGVSPMNLNDEVPEWDSPSTTSMPSIDDELPF